MTSSGDCHQDCSVQVQVEHHEDIMSGGGAGLHPVRVGGRAAGAWPYDPVHQCTWSDVPPDEKDGQASVNRE